MQPRLVLDAGIVQGGVMKWRVVTLLVAMMPVGGARAERVVPEILLWQDAEPKFGARVEGMAEPTPCGYRKVKDPSLTVHLPKSGEGPVSAVFVLPGGGYVGVCTLTEGTAPALWLADEGIAAFVLKYRMPEGEPEVPLEDVGRALYIIRANAEGWGVDANRLGVWGFSAGGHLAAMTSHRHDVDFTILFYPVITMEEGVTHGGSRRNLLGDQAAALAEAFSAERQVSARTPPAFLLHARDDKAVPIENSLRYYRAQLGHGLSAEAFFPEKGGHGPAVFRQNPAWEHALTTWLQRRAQ